MELLSIVLIVVLFAIAVTTYFVRKSNKKVLKNLKTELKLSDTNWEDTKEEIRKLQTTNANRNLKITQLNKEIEIEKRNKENLINSLKSSHSKELSKITSKFHEERKLTDKLNGILGDVNESIPTSLVALEDGKKVDFFRVRTKKNKIEAYVRRKNENNKYIDIPIKLELRLK